MTKPELLSVPESARKEHVCLWHTVLTKRTKQLQSLSSDSLRTLLKEFSPPEDKTEIIEWIRIVLINAFHISIDPNVNSSLRLESLEDLKRRLQSIDDAHARHHLSQLPQQLPPPTNAAMPLPPALQQPTPQNNNNPTITITTNREPEVIEIEIDDTDDEQEQQPNDQPSTTANTHSEQKPPSTGTDTNITTPVIIEKEKRKVRKEGTYEKKLRSVSLIFGAEVTPYVALQPRTISLAGSIEVQDGNPTTRLDGNHLDEFYDRLQEWDPYWRIFKDCSTYYYNHEYEMGYQTSQFVSHAPTEVKTAVQISVLIDSDPKTGIFYSPDDSFFAHPSSSAPGIRQNCVGPNGQRIAWGTNANNNPPFIKHTYTDGMRRLILRTLPFKRSDYEKKKRADTHIWPKGTYLQMDLHTKLPLIQRKQQSHDAALWKGQCHICDLTPYTMSSRLSLEMCTRDPQSYMVQVAICDYQSPDSLYQQCITPNTPHTLKRLSHQQGLDMALLYVNRPAVVLDDSDDENDNENKEGSTIENNSLTIRMLCPMSMTPMETPTRGKDCQHMQCFDLLNFIHTNATVSGGRWRCAVCENFVSLQNCIIDGYQQSILQTYSDQLSSIRDKVQIFSNGTHALMEENRLRYNKKQNNTNDANPTDSNDNSNEPPNKRVKTDGSNNTVTEIIDLD